jgi:hypothetical protein
LSLDHVDGRDEPGHDGFGCCVNAAIAVMQYNALQRHSGESRFT